MTDQPNNETHTPGPWRVGNNGHVANHIYAGPESINADAICMVYGIWQNKDVADASECGGMPNARLIAAACTSYDKHFGPSAVSAAEGDALGEMVAVLRKCREYLADSFTGADGHRLIARIDALLAKTTPNTAATRQEQSDG